MRATSTHLSLICLLLSACAHPNLVEAGLSHQEKTDQAIIRDYFVAITAKDQTTLARVLAENVKVTVGTRSWNKATEIKNRTDQWVRDPNYSVEIRSITGAGDTVKARVIVTYRAHGRVQSQEIENVFKVQNKQIIQAVLSP